MVVVKTVAFPRRALQGLCGERERERDAALIWVEMCVQRRRRRRLRGIGRDLEREQFLSWREKGAVREGKGRAAQQEHTTLLFVGFRATDHSLFLHTTTHNTTQGLSLLQLNRRRLPSQPVVDPPHRLQKQQAKTNLLLPQNQTPTGEGRCNIASLPGASTTVKSRTRDPPNLATGWRRRNSNSSSRARACSPR